jgi:hypothetical protein
LQALVVTSEKKYHCLNPFMYLWDKYIGIYHSPFEVVVCGFSKPQPNYYLSDFTEFYSLGNQEDWPMTRWSDKLIAILDEIADEQFILLLEDYWIVRPADVSGIRMLFDYAKQFKNVLKIDLGTDRLYINGGSSFLYGQNTYDNVGYLDLVLSPPGTPYQMSLWGGIWNRDQLKKVLIPGETPHDIEIAGSSRVKDRQLVLGTRQAPLKHGNIYQSRNNGNPVYVDTGWAVKLSDMEFMRGQLWI